MSRNRPTNIQASLQNSSVLIEWEVDSFFGDPEPPDNIIIELGAGGPNRSLGGDERSVELDAAELTPFAGMTIAVNIGFQWDGGVPEWGSIGIFIPADGPGSPFPPPVPNPSKPPPPGPISVSGPFPILSRMVTLLWQNPVSYDKILVRWGVKNTVPKQFELGGVESADCGPISPNLDYVFEVKGGTSVFLGGFNYSDWRRVEWRSPEIDWSRAIPSQGHEKVAANTSPTSWYTTDDKVQHIGYVGAADRQIHECFFHTDGGGGWQHNVPSQGQERVAPNTSATSWYTAHEKVQHIAYVGTDQQIHEMFFPFGGTGWLHSIPSFGHEKVAPGTSPTSWVTVHDKVQHIAYVGATDQQIHECFFHTDGGSGWQHNVPSMGQEKVAPNSSPTSWYTAPENFQHIAYVGTDLQIHEMFFHPGGTGWLHSMPSFGQEKVAPNTSPTSWYTTPENVQHIAYVGSNHDINQCFFFIGGFGGWRHEVTSAGRPKVAPGTSPTSWYTTPENVQHIAYVGNNADIHELFFFVRAGGDHTWHHRELIRSFVAPGTSLTSWYSTPENVQHIAYVGADFQIHELFYFIV